MVTRGGLRREAFGRGRKSAIFVPSVRITDHAPDRRTDAIVSAQITRTHQESEGHLSPTGARSRRRRARGDQADRLSARRPCVCDAIAPADTICSFPKSADTLDCRTRRKLHAIADE